MVLPDHPQLQSPSWQVQSPSWQVDPASPYNYYAPSNPYPWPPNKPCLRWLSTPNPPYGYFRTEASFILSSSRQFFGEPGYRLYPPVRSWPDW
jgi:hypothetical protein